MAKHQKLLSCQLDQLPDEVILKIVGFLDLKKLLLFGQVSKRLQAITNDESLWLKLNFYNRKVPYGFIEKAAGNGCQYLSLHNCHILNFTGKSESSFNLKYLNVYNARQGVQKLVQNCTSLQKLSITNLHANLELDSLDIQYICQNGQTLKVLDLQGCNIAGRIAVPFAIAIEPLNRTKLLQDLFANCTHLTELNISHMSLLDPQHIWALVDNLTPTILKLAVGGRLPGGHKCNLIDEHVKKLINRCNNITHLELSYTLITNDSVRSIIEILDTSLEKLNVSETNVDLASLLQLKSMSELKTLICFPEYPRFEDIKYLKQQLPHININKEREFLIAKPSSIDHWIDPDLIWEIRTKEQKLFAKIR